MNTHMHTQVHVQKNTFPEPQLHSFEEKQVVINAKFSVQCYRCMTFAQGKKRLQRFEEMSM